MQDSRASISVSLAQTGYCAEQGWDWQWPQCGHVILTGNIVMLEVQYLLIQFIMHNKQPNKLNCLSKTVLC